MYQPLPDDRVIRVRPEYYTYTTTPGHLGAPPAPAPSPAAITVPCTVVGQASIPVAVAPAGATLRSRSPVAIHSTTVPTPCIVQTSPPPRMATVIGTQVVVTPQASHVYYDQPPRDSSPQVESVNYEAGVWQRLSESPRKASDIGGGTSSNESILELLDSLEARVDLMSQMQHTRAAIQKRALAVQAMQAAGVWDQHGEMLLDEYLDGAVSPGSRSQPSGDGDDSARLRAASSSNQSVHEPSKSAQLWSQVVDQSQCISILNGEVASMRQQLQALSSTAMGTASTMTGDTAATSSALSSSQGQVSGNDMTCTPAAMATVPVPAVASLGERVGMDVTQPVPLLEGVGRVSAGPLPPSPRRSVRSASPLALRSQSPMRFLASSPGFSRETCGLNLEISADSFRAARTRGCRQAAAVGANPLPSQTYGRYFEVVVEETVAGWVGGLGIGVTATPPEQVRRVPDKAWRMPNTFIIGYWGCIFLDGVERRTNWLPETISIGAHVGLLVSDEGDLLVFVDRKPAVRVEGVNLAAMEKLYPVVDVFAATRVLTLVLEASPPAPPWDVPTSGNSRGGSLASRPQSLCGGSSVAQSWGRTDLPS
mmetsp:Transcript_52976/g.133867  ORF Transcript_52976/g.133867 Transcript_52976/m.133867 type:complete len:595 (+) Transcript_52976:86-1870(+)